MVRLVALLTILEWDLVLSAFHVLLELIILLLRIVLDLISVDVILSRFQSLLSLSETVKTLLPLHNKRTFTVFLFISDIVFNLTRGTTARCRHIPFLIPILKVNATIGIDLHVSDRLLLLLLLKLLLLLDR